MDMEPTPEKKKDETSKPKKPKSALQRAGSQLAVGGIFTGGMIALLKALDTVGKFPEQMRTPLYWLCMIVLSITVSVFGISFVRQMLSQSKTSAIEEKYEREKQALLHEIEMRRLSNDRTVEETKTITLERKRRDTEQVENADIAGAAEKTLPTSLPTSTHEPPLDISQYTQREPTEEVIIEQRQDDEPR